MKSGIVKLGDFGIAKGLKSTWEKAKTMVGTPYYLSPEIITNKPYDSKSDIWALGVLLYELMTFKMPFNAVSLPLLSIKINRGVYQPPPGIYSSEIKDLLKKCLTLEPEKRPSIDEILKLPLIKNRINNFLTEVQYDQDLSKTMTKKYKDKKREEKHKQKEEKENKNDKKDNQDNNTSTSTNNTSKGNNDKEKETKQSACDRNQFNSIRNRKKEKTGIKKEGKPSNVISDNTTKTNTSSNSNINKSLNETNFLLPKKDPNFEQGKLYKEDEIGKTLKSKGYKDLLDEKNGKFDVNKMNEDQYNQLRLLNNLHKVANNLAQDSDSEISVNSSVSSIPSSKSVDIYVEEDIVLDIPKEKENEKKEITKDKMEQCKNENNEIESIKKEIENEIGQDLFKEIINLIDKSCDKTEVKFDRDLICNNIKDLTNKGFDKVKVEKALEKIEEIFAVLMKDRLFSK